MSTLAILSILHQPTSGAGSPCYQAGASSATRQFRGASVLGWTVRRLAACQRLSGIAVLCWSDQLAHVHQAATGIEPARIGERQPRPVQEMVCASRRWSSGWRGGFAGTCALDLGFDAKAILQ